MAFTEDQKVFAKIRGYPPWPARILEITGQNTKNIRYKVYFYGTRDSAFLKFSEISPFLEMKAIFGTQKRLKNFNEAMTEIMSDLTPVEKSKLEALKATSSHARCNAESTEPHNITGEEDNEVLESNLGRKFRKKSFPDCETSNKCEPLEFMMGKETIRIPYDKERLNFYKIEGEILEIDLGIRKSLAIGTNHNLPVCIKLLDDLYNLKVTPIMLKKHSDIIYTLRKSRRYHISGKNKDIEDQAATIRNKSSDLLLKFEKLFTVPEGVSFYSYFERIQDEFELQYGHLSIQEYADLM